MMADIFGHITASSHEKVDCPTVWQCCRKSQGLMGAQQGLHIDYLDRAQQSYIHKRKSFTSAHKRQKNGRKTEMEAHVSTTLIHTLKHSKKHIDTQYTIEDNVNTQSKFSTDGTTWAVRWTGSSLGSLCTSTFLSRLPSLGVPGDSGISPGPYDRKERLKKWEENRSHNEEKNSRCLILGRPMLLGWKVLRTALQKAKCQAWFPTQTFPATG